MKRNIDFTCFPLLILLLFSFAGCSKDEVSESETKQTIEEELTEITFNVQMPEDARTRGEINKGMDGLDNVDWSQYDMRFIMEIWRADAIATNPYVFYRDTIISPDFTSSVSFNAKVIQGILYDILFWVDIVKTAAPGSLDYGKDYIYGTIGYGTDGLKSVSRNAYTAIQNDKCDGFSAATRQINAAAIKTKNIILKRPLAKLITEVTNIGDADNLTVAYPATKDLAGGGNTGPNVMMGYNMWTNDFLSGSGNFAYYNQTSVTINSQKIFQLWDYIFSKIEKTYNSGSGPVTVDGRQTIDYTIVGYKGAQPIYATTIYSVPLQTNYISKVSLDASTFTKIYKAGDYYEKGNVKGIVYNVVETISKNPDWFNILLNGPKGYEQTLDIFSLDEPTSGAYETVSYSQADAFCTGKNTGGVTGWHLPTLEEMKKVSQAVKDVGAGNLDLLIIGPKGGTPLSPHNFGIQYQDYPDNTVADGSFAYWTSTDSGTNKYVKWMADGAAVNNTYTSPKTAGRYVRAVKTGILNSD